MPKKKVRTTSTVKKSTPKGVSKKAVKSVSKTSGQAVSKRYGKTVQKKTASGGTIGYATVTKTKLPKYDPKKTGTGSSQHKKSVRVSRKKK